MKTVIVQYTIYMHRTIFSHFLLKLPLKSYGFIFSRVLYDILCMCTRFRISFVSSHWQWLYILYKNEFDIFFLGRTQKRVSSYRLFLLGWGHNCRVAIELFFFLAKGIERYDKSNNAWKHYSELPEPRLHYAVTILNGKIYVAG